MLLLSLDTSTSAITVALHDGSHLVAERAVLDARAHAEHLTPLVTAALADVGAAPRDVTDVVCGLGPGPFTGLRVGIVTARTLALATGARLLGVCSLDALAYQAWRELGRDGELVVATDARRKEVYWATYAMPSSARGWPDRLHGPSVTRPADLPDELRGIAAVGRGPGLYPDFFAVQPDSPVTAMLDVSAGAMAELVVRRLAAGDDVALTGDHEPYYLRRPDAVPSATVKSALG